MATAASPKVTKKKPTAPGHPSYFAMAKDAVITLADQKGSSVQSIRTFIAEKYDISADVVRVHLKPALAKGIENGTFLRPISSDAKGYTGRFKINKTMLAEESKVAARKEKKKIAEEKASTSKPKSSKPNTKSDATKKVTKKTGIKSSDGIKKSLKKTPTTVTKRRTKVSPKAKKILKTPKQSKTASKLGRKKQIAA